MRCLIYTRVSTDQQEMDGTSLESQLTACLAYATNRGYDVAGSFADTYTGAQYRDRPGLTELRQALAGESIDVVVCYALDRLSRNQAHVAILIEEITDAGAKLELVTEEFEDSAVGRFVLSARAFVAEVEREKIAERTARGRRTRVESGKIMPGPKPLYGYAWTDDRTAYLIDPVESAIVRRIFREYANGASLRAIGRGLEEDGIPAPAGGATWWPSTIRQILTDRNYSGTAHALRWSYVSGRRVLLEPDEAVALPDGTVPPLVDAAEQEAIIARLERQRLAAPRNNRQPEASLLRAGFAYCGLCHTPLSVSNTSNPPYGQYRCRARAPLAKFRLHYMAISRDGLDAAVWERIRAFMLSDMLVNHLHDARQASAAPDHRELREAERALTALDRQRDNLTRAIGQTDDPGAVAALLRQLEEQGKQRQAIHNEQAQLEQEMANVAAFEAAVADLNTWRRQVAANMDTMAYQERRQLLEHLGIKVWVYPADRTPRWHITSNLFPDIVFRRAGSARHNNERLRIAWPDSLP